MEKKKSESMQATKESLSPPSSVQENLEACFLRPVSADFHFRAWKYVSTLPESEHKIQDQSVNDSGWNVEVNGTKYNYSWSKFAIEGVPTETDIVGLSHPTSAQELLENMNHSLPVGRRTHLRPKPLPNDQEFIIMQRQWIDPDSKDENVARLSTEALREEIAMSCALKATAFVVRLREHSPKLCEIVNEYVMSVQVNHVRTAMKIWALVPVLQPAESATHPWFWWVNLRTLTDENILTASLVSLCLDVNLSKEMWSGTYMPYGEFRFPLRADIMRWFGEPVSCLRIVKSMLRKHRWVDANFEQLYPPPVTALVPEQDDFLRFALGYGGSDINMIIDGDANLEQLNVESQMKADVLALHYVTFIYQIRYENGPLEIALGGRASRETICHPIQPLAVNICPTHYDGWEMDTVKYDKYREALIKALYHLAYDKENMQPIVFVLGAGQGPLVIEVVRAAKEVREELRSIYAPMEVARRFEKFGFAPRIYAVEKNPQALPKLKERYEKLWKDENVEIVEMDMRLWNPGFTADLVVSELIGGFACNELSPECLENARHLMRPDTICFPSRYDSFLIPIMSTNVDRVRREWYIARNLLPSDQWIVSRCHNRFNVCGTDYRRVFSFRHPICDDNVDERLYTEKVMEWPGPLVDCELDGFMGFFTVWLQRKTPNNTSITLANYSIVPHLHTPNMHAWYPIFFPLQGNRVKVRAGEPIKAWMARRRNADGSRVWYEWRLLSPKLTPILNEGGACASMSTVIGQRDDLIASNSSN